MPKRDAYHVTKKLEVVEWIRQHGGGYFVGRILFCSYILMFSYFDVLIFC